MNKTNRILVVDDDPAILQVYSEILRTEGYEVLEASTGQEGLRITREKRPDVVLLDVVLSDRSGTDICREIKAAPALADVFVVLFSGMATDTHHKVEGLVAGADDYIVKPVEPDEFLARVRTITRLQQAAAALRASEQHYRRLVELLPEAVCLLDAQGRLLSVNPRGVEMWGYANASELLQKSLFELASPEDAEGVRAEIARTLASVQVRNAEHTLLKRGGRVFPAQLLAVAVGADGPPASVLLVVQDISERKQFEKLLTNSIQALLDNTQFLETLVDAIPSPVFYKDASGRYLGCNSAFEKSLGLTETQIQGKTAYDLAPGDLAEAYIRADEELLAKPGIQAYEGSVVYADGSRHEVVFNKATFCNAEGNVAGVVGIILDLTERKRAETQIRLLADAVQSTGEMICITDTEDRFIFVNRAFRQAFGYSESEILGKTPEILFSPKNRPSLMAEILAQTRQGGWQGEVLDRRKDGSELAIFLSTSQIKDATGQVLGLMGVSQDITARKQAEANLRESEEKFRTLFASAPIGIALHDASGHYVHTNQAYQHLVGYTNHELRRLGFETCLCPEGATEVPRLFGEMREGKRDHYRRELCYRHKSGRTVWTQSSASAVRSDRGELRFIISMVEDITHRKEAMEALRQSERKLRLIAENTTDVIFAFDLERRPLYINPAVEKLTGYTFGEIQAAKFINWIHPEDQERMLKHWEELYAGKGYTEVEYRLVTKAGQVKWCSSTWGPLADEDGRQIGVQGRERDITALKLAEKQKNTLSQLCQRLSEAASPEQVAGIIFETASDLFPWDAGYVASYSEAEDRVTPVLSFDTVQSQRVPFPPSSPPTTPTPLMRLVLKDGARLLTDETELAVSVAGVPFGDLEQRSASGMFVPIRFGAAVMGFLTLQTYAPEAYSREDLQLLQTLADHCGGALQRIAAAEALHRADAKYRSIVENASEGIFQTTPAGRYLSANPALARMFGYQSTEELTRNVTNLDQQAYVSPERRSELKRLLESKGTAEGFEAQCSRKDGSRFWVSINARAVRGADGEVLYYEGTNLDITQQKETAEALRQAEARYRSIFEHATEGIFQTTPEGRFRIANPALADMLGYESPAELMASVADLAGQMYVKPERREEFKGLMEEQGSVEGFEFEHYRKDGSVIWVSINAHSVRGADGRIVYYEGTVQDISKRKQAEEAFEMSQVLQQALLDNIPDPAWLKDVEGRFLACNEPLAKLLGQPRAGIVGRTLFEVDPSEATHLTGEDNQVLQSGKPIRFEQRRLDAQGGVQWFEAIKSPLLNERGQATGTVGIARDITERKWAENLLRAQRDFSVFLSSTNDLSAAARRLLTSALESEGLDCGAVYLVRSQSGALGLAMHHGLSAGFARRAFSFAAGGAAGTSPAEAGPMARLVEQLQREALRALEVIPIQHAEEVVAVLGVGSHQHADIPRKTLQAIEALAAQAGGALARIRAEQSSRTDRQLLEKTLHSIHAAVFILDANATVIQECNPAATLLFGYERSELLGKTPGFLHPVEAVLTEFKDHLEAAGASKGQPKDFELRMWHRDGTSLPTEHSVAPIRDEAGQVQSWVDVVRDITERKRHEEGLHEISRRIIEAQEAERLRVARELHDSVNQLIASAKMRLRKVQETLLPSPAAREMLMRCDDLLVQALEENRRIAHNLRPSDLDGLGLTEACRNFCKQLQARTNLTVKYRAARMARRYPPAIELNLFRIVQEALNNVEKHARAKTVTVGIGYQSGQILLRIQDDGRGFKPKTSDAVRHKGQGIGLTNIRERTASLGGSCEFATAPNQGTAITVRVPYECQR